MVIVNEGDALLLIHVAAEVPVRPIYTLSVLLDLNLTFLKLLPFKMGTHRIRLVGAST